MCCVATPFPTNAFTGVEVKRGRKLVQGSANERACKLAKRRQQKSRFCTCHCGACMRIAMVTSDRLDDVTSEPADVFDRCHQSKGHGLVCQQLRIASQHSQHRQCSAVHSGSRGTPFNSLVRLPSSSKRSKVERSCRASSRKCGDKTKESKEDVITWRIGY